MKKQENQSAFSDRIGSGGQGTLDVMKDCWKHGDISYHGNRGWTQTGTPCQSWRKQFPHPHTYDIQDGPYCR